MPKFADMNDAQLTAWATNFAGVVGAAPADYGLTAAQVTELENTGEHLQAKMTSRVAAEDAARAAVAAQKAGRAALEPLCTYYNTIIKANPSISDAQKSAAGIDVKKPPTHTAPAMPTGLTANGFENGTNVLRWERAGNKPSTQFIVECRAAAETAFEYLGTTTEITYTHTGATPGKQCAYRVKAQRAGEESQYSNVAVVYMS